MRISDRFSATKTSTRLLFSDLAIKEEMLKEHIDTQMVDDLLNSSKAFYQKLSSYQSIIEDYSNEIESKKVSRRMRG